MHSLILLLGVAAGVNAILGGNIEAVVLPGNQFICAEDCVHQGVFFGTQAACLENETVLRVDKDDQPSIDLNTGSALACRGEPGLSRPGQRQRERKAGEAPEQCELQRIIDPKNIGCFSNRGLDGDPAGETVQWADVAKLLEEAAGAAGQGSQPQAPSTQPQPPNCGANKVLLDGECVSQGTRQRPNQGMTGGCGEGQVRIDGECVKQRCGPGQTLLDGECVKSAQTGDLEASCDE